MKKVGLFTNKKSFIKEMPLDEDIMKGVEDYKPIFLLNSENTEKIDCSEDESDPEYFPPDNVFSIQPRSNNIQNPEDNEEGETDNDDEAGETDKNDEAGETDKNDEASETDKNDEASETDKNDEAGETDKNDEASETGEASKTGEASETDNDDETDNDTSDMDADMDEIETSKKHKKKKKSNDEQIQSILAELLFDIEAKEDLSTQILNYMKEINWKDNLSEEDIMSLQPLYDKVCEEISFMPKISDILKLSIPYDEKCDIIEKILILYNAQPNTFEFLQLKRHLNKIVEKHKKFVLTEEDYNKYQNIEKSLTVNENTYKPLKFQILDAKIPDVNKAYLFERYKYFSSLDSSNSEYNKLKQWLDYALNLPYQLKPMKITHMDTSYKINKYLWTVKNLLDEEIYGLDSVKEKILFLLNNRITNNNSKGLSFALCGPPGTAKTSIINTLSKAIDLPFFQINLGGAKDVSFLSGHSYTYEGAAPGVIAQALISLKYKNGIIYFDEFDKISNTLHGTEISRMLLHITDFSQNDKFHDRYFSNGINIDLSNIWFIYSLNDQELLDKTLADRIPIIFIDGYNKKEKFQITKNYIIPKALKNINLTEKHVCFSDDSIEYLILISENNLNSKNKKTGVRQIKHLVDNMLMKINLLKTISSYKNKPKYKLDLSFNVENFKLPLIITREIIDQLKIANFLKEDTSFRHMYL